MTRIRRIDLTCPVCEVTFPSYAVAASAAPNERRTDFHERQAGMQALPYLVHMCGTCGYAGGAELFEEGAEVTPTLRSWVYRELTPRLEQPGRAQATQAFLGSDKYEAAAKVAEQRGLGARQVGDLLLRAAWCCVDEGDREAERYFRRQAAWAFGTALASYDGVEPEARATLCYLVGELWRRIGDASRAAHWFGRVEAEVVDGERQRWILTVARQQSEAPREWFA